MSYGDCIDCGVELVNGEGLCPQCLEDVVNERVQQAFEEGASVAFGMIGMAEAIARNQLPAAAAYKMFDVAKEAYELWRRGYDGPFMGEEIEPLFKALAALDAVTYKKEK